MSDYISREEAIRVIDELYVKRPLDSDRFVLTGVGSRLEELPAADVRPVVRGKWKDVEVTYVADKTTLPFECISSMRCNQCNRYYTEIYYYGNPTEMAHFCPHCGADMRQTGDENV